MGGEERIARQHESGRLTVREHELVRYELNRGPKTRGPCS